jgi:hypothetical protein
MNTKHTLQIGVYTGRILNENCLEIKWEYNETVRQLIKDFRKTYDLLMCEVLYNILIEFGGPTKLVTLIKMCLNETYSEARRGTHLSDTFRIRNGHT